MSKDKSKEEKIVMPSEEDVARYSAGDAAGEKPTQSSEAGKTAVSGESAAVAELQAQLAECRDKLLRSQAECANVAKRLNQQHSESLRMAGMALARDMLPVVDAFERMLASMETSGVGEQIISGVNLVFDQLRKSLRSHGVSPIDSVGKPFDPSIHQALMQDRESKSPPGVITAELERGYMMHDRVLRAAKVAVAAELPPASEAAEGVTPENEGTEAK